MSEASNILYRVEYKVRNKKNKVIITNGITGGVHIIADYAMMAPSQGGRLKEIFDVKMYAMVELSKWEKLALAQLFGYKLKEYKESED